MTLRLSGATSGYTEIDAPAVAGNNTLLLPTGNGAADQALVTNGSGALSWSDRGRMTLGTAQTASGTAVDFTGIPSWVKRVTVMFNTISLTSTAHYLVQIGSGSFATSGYSSGSGIAYGTNQTTNIQSTAGFVIVSGAGTNTVTGTMEIYSQTGTVWIASHATTIVGGGASGGGNSPSLGGTLDRVRITSTSGTDTFDAGIVNILYEG